MHRTRSYVLKAILFSFALFIETLIISSLLFNFAISKNYFSIDWNFVGLLTAVLLLICYTYALTVGAWDTWLQYIIVPLPISLGTALIVARINLAYGMIVFFTVYMFSAYDVYFATQLKEQLIKFNPKIILRFSTKGILLIFALISGLLIFISPVSPDEVNTSVVSFIADIADKQTKIILNNSMEQNENLAILKRFGLVSLDFKTLFTNQISTVLEPYKHFILPIIAILVAGSIQFLNGLVYLLFAVTVDLVFMLAKRSGILKTEYRDVKQETLTY